MKSQSTAGSFFEAATRSETLTGGVTKAKFKYNDEGLAREGKVFAQNGKAKLSLGSTIYCDNIESRKYGSDRYTLYDDTCALVSRTSSSALKATVNGNEYIAWVMYGGGVDLPTMNWMADPPVAYTPPELAAAKAAFVDGQPVEMIVDWSEFFTERRQDAARGERRSVQGFARRRRRERVSGYQDYRERVSIGWQFLQHRSGIQIE
jgi:hypothetical protein